MISCTDKEELPKEWQFEKVIALYGVNPIGIATDGNHFFLSDGDHNRIVQVNNQGNILFELDGFERPMHIDYGTTDLQITDKRNTSKLEGSVLFIPEYGRDSIAILSDDKISYLAFNDSLDAPAGISVYKDEIAIADFYNNQIHYYNGSKWIKFGKEGKALGDFYYPTDVQITADKIYVADAYNNRGQVFDKTGKPLVEFGQDQNFNAATGIYVTETEIFLTDFENDRIVIFGMDYKLKQVLDAGIDKPTDIIVIDDTLHVTNYRKGELVHYKLATSSHKKMEKENDDHHEH